MALRAEEKNHSKAMWLWDFLNRLPIPASADEIECLRLSVLAQRHGKR